MWLKPSGGKRGRGDVWRVDQVYTKITLNFYKKLKFIPVFLEGVVVLSKKKKKSNLHKYKRTEKFY